MSVKRYVGIAEESSFAVSPAPSAVVHMDIASASLDAKGDSQLIYGGGLGRNAKTSRPGFYSPDGNFVYAFDINTIGYLLAWALGEYDYTIAGAATPDEWTLFLDTPSSGTYELIGNGYVIPLAYNASDAVIQSALEVAYGEGLVTVVASVITFDESVMAADLTADFTELVDAYAPTLTNSDAFVSGLSDHRMWGTSDSELPSFCTRIGKDNFEHVFSGCVINTLELKIEGDYCTVTAGIMSSKDSKTTIVEIDSLLLPDEYPLAFYEVTAKKDSSDISSKIKSLTISISNNFSAESGRGLGSMHPYRFIANERVVTISKPIFYENTTALEEIWGSATGPTEAGQTEFELELTFDSGDYGSMVMTFPSCVYTAVQQQPSGRGEITQDISIRALTGLFTPPGGVEANYDMFVELYNLHASEYITP